MDAMRTIDVDARPAPFCFDQRTAAMVVVDMQNDFGSAGGMFDRAGIDIAPIQAIIEPIRDLLVVVRQAGIPVMYLKMGFEADLFDAGCPDSPTWLKHLPFGVGADVTAPDGSVSRILVRDTWNTDIVNDLSPEPGDTVLYKHRYSGFYGTELQAVLRERGVTTLIVVGATTSVCVDSTVRDAMFRDFHCLVLEDCTAEPIGATFARSNHDATLLTLELLFAHVTNSQSLTAAIRSVFVETTDRPTVDSSDIRVR
jgi:ureidoacrylate peracid hydrolase